MSLYSICKSVLAQTGWTVFNTIAANSDATAVQIKELANEELRQLSKRYDWLETEVEYSFNTVVGQHIYLLPEDYRRSKPGSMFNAVQYYTVRGSVEQQEWNYRRHGLYASLDRQHYKLKFNGTRYAIELAAPPSSVEELLFVYQTKEFAVDDAGFSKLEYEADTDVAKIPEDLVKLGLKWRFREAKGMDFSAALAEYNTTINQQFAQSKDRAEIPVGGRRLLDTNPLTSGYVPDTGFGS